MPYRYDEAKFRRLRDKCDRAFADARAAGQRARSAVARIEAVKAMISAHPIQRYLDRAQGRGDPAQQEDYVQRHFEAADHRRLELLRSDLREAEAVLARVMERQTELSEAVQRVGRLVDACTKALEERGMTPPAVEPIARTEPHVIPDITIAPNPLLPTASTAGIAR